MMDPFFAKIEAFNSVMSLLVWPLSVLAFIAGTWLGRIHRRRMKAESRSLAEMANRFYVKGYSAARAEYQRPAAKSCKLEIVGGKDA